MKPVVAIVQARIGSSRFPGKVLANLWGKTLLEWLILRAQSVDLIDRIVVATTLDKRDDALVAEARRLNVDVFRGSEDDVLTRYSECARAFGARTVVRLTADDPVKDPGLISRAIRLLDDACADYVSTSLRPTFPEGLDVEVLTAEALFVADREARLRSEREHVTPYIWNRPARFKLAGIEAEVDYSRIRWTVDYEDDLTLISRLLESHRDNVLVNYKELLATYLEDRSIQEGVAERERNEGYLKSLDSEKS